MEYSPLVLTGQEVLKQETNEVRNRFSMDEEVGGRVYGYEEPTRVWIGIPNETRSRSAERTTARHRGVTANGMPGSEYKLLRESRPAMPGLNVRQWQGVSPSPISFLAPW